MQEIDIPGTRTSEYNASLRKRSGEVYGSPAAGFFYVLMRDGHVSPGKLERLLREAEEEALGDRQNQFTNGWLAEYAKDIENRLWQLTMKTNVVDQETCT